MNLSDRGVKHLCPDCASKYYDMKKENPVCPSCGAKPPAPKLSRYNGPARKTTRTTFRRYS